MGLVRLPDGYRTDSAGGRLRLLDPQGKLLLTHPRPETLLEIEERAWRQAWGDIEREIRQELREFRAGTRTVRELHRLRQYVRLLTALADAAPETRMASPTQKPARFISRQPSRISWPTPRLAGLAFAGGLVAGLLAFVLLSANTPIPPVSQGPAPGPEALAPSQPSHARLGARRPSLPAVSMSGAPRAVRNPPRRNWGYATTFGHFTNLEAAQVRARLVRTKGYLAKVVPTGRSFRVLGRIYSTRRDAERMAKIFREIGLPTTVRITGT